MRDIKEQWSIGNNGKVETMKKNKTDMKGQRMDKLTNGEIIHNKMSKERYEQECINCEASWPHNFS